MAAGPDPIENGGDAAAHSAEAAASAAKAGPHDPPPRRHGAKLVGAAVVFAALGGLGWYVYDRAAGPGVSSREVPLIRADDGPTKIRPEDPGGMVVPNQDKLVYETLGGEGAEETVERLLPPPEEPLPPPEPPEPAAEAEETVAAPGPGIEPKTEPAAEPEQAPPLPPAEAAPEAAEVAPEAAAEDEAVAAVSPPPEPEAPAKTGPYLVQLASFREIAEADRAWWQLIKKNRDLLGAFTARVERADLGADQGVFFRLRVGPFAGEAEAKALCGKLEARNVDCLVVRP